MLYLILVIRCKHKVNRIGVNLILKSCFLNSLYIKTSIIKIKLLWLNQLWWVSHSHNYMITNGTSFTIILSMDNFSYLFFFGLLLREFFCVSRKWNLIRWLLIWQLFGSFIHAVPIVFFILNSNNLSYNHCPLMPTL